MLPRFLPSLAPGFVVLFVAAILVVAGAGGVAAAVPFALEFSATSVDPGDTILVDVVVPETGDEFNGYDAVLTFDALRLSPLLPSPPSAGEGALFTQACGLRFLDVSDDGDSTRVRISHVVLCAGLSLQGPGTLYSLAFVARGTTGTATIGFDADTRAYDAGFDVPVVYHDPIAIQVGTTTDAPAPVQPVVLSVAPNPFNPATEIRFELARDALARLEIFDVSGRHVRTLHDGSMAAGSQRLRWDGRDDEGLAVASGLYFARLRAPQVHAHARLVLLR